METVVTAYLLVGAIVGLLIWRASFKPDFDQFIKDEYGQEPPSFNQKIATIVSGIFIWPVHLYWWLRS